MKKKVIASVISLLLIIAIVSGVAGFFSFSVYKAENSVLAENQTSYSAESFTVNKLDNGNIELVPDDVKAGLVFYPGGNVQHTAYIPFLENLADKGILCIIVKMPLNLAVLNPNGAKGICDNYPEVKKWYIGGHSLGGAMAGAYLSKATDDFEGLILLAAYSSSDLSSLDIDVISIYGECDEVMNRENYNKYKSNLPERTFEYVIDGGCHSYFGDYGMQRGDGTPTITREEQFETTANYISSKIL